MGFFEQFRGDLICLRGALRTLKATTPIAKHPNRVFPLIIDELADRHGDAPALLSDREQFSYRELAARANRYARWTLAQRLAKGDTVCLIMPNRPEYLAFWLGVTSVGGVVALINTNLTGVSLAHCINVVHPTHVVVAAELLEAFETARPQVTGNPKVWLHGGDSGHPRIDLVVDSFSGDPLAGSERLTLTIEDRALYIYTSGTTGLPKAANMNHYRVMLACIRVRRRNGNADASDRMYDCLPMYHTAGGLVATGALLARGGSVVIRERFSAREFWDDIVRWDCTLVQYIGELCRYLVNSAAASQGDGASSAARLRQWPAPDVWGEFQRRFEIPHIVEFYAATEGNVTLFNFEGKEGAVGRLPWFLAGRFPVKVVQFDVEASAARARRARLLHRMRRGRTGRGDRQDHQGRGETRRALRGLRRRRRRPTRRSCTTCSRRATPGSAPAT